MIREKIFNILFAINSTSWIFFVFFAKTKNFSWEYFFILVLIFIFIVCFGWLLTLFFKGKIFEEIIKPSDFEVHNDNFLPIHLGYFFVALSVPNLITLIVIYLMIVLFTCLSKTNYYNPTLFLLGYNYYILKTEYNSTIHVLSKREIKLKNDCIFCKLCRISDYFYIDIEDYEREED